MVLFNQGEGPSVVMPRITPDMGHQYRQTLHLQELMVRIFETYVLAVAVARNAHQRLESPDLICKGKAPAEIAGMPYDIHWSKELLEWLAEHSVSVAYEADVHFP